MAAATLWFFPEAVAELAFGERPPYMLPRHLAGCLRWRADVIRHAWARDEGGPAGLPERSGREQLLGATPLALATRREPAFHTGVSGCPRDLGALRTCQPASSHSASRPCASHWKVVGTTGTEAATTCCCIRGFGSRRSRSPAWSVGGRAFAACGVFARIMGGVSLYQPTSCGRGALHGEDQQLFAASAFSRSAIFPVFALEYSRYEACAVEEVNLGPSSSSIGFATDSSGKGDPLLAERKGKNEVDLVRECQKMVEDYGLSVVARDGSSDPSPVVGVATMRVKRLPTDCHITEEDDGTKEVECMVDFDAAYSAPGLEAVAYLEMIAVSKDWRGSGLSNKLMDWIETKARTWGLNILALHVHRDNWAALRFYERNGFEASSDWLGMGPSFFLLVKPL